jgi:hypothetical protein
VALHRAEPVAPEDDLAEIRVELDRLVLCRASWSIIDKEHYRRLVRRESQLLAMLGSGLHPDEPEIDSAPAPARH